MEGVGGSARARSVERGKRAVGSAHEAMTHIARVDVVSRDRPLRIDVEAEDRGKGTLAVTCPRARNIERGERAARSPQEAMTHVAVVSVVSRDGACRVNATVAEGALRKRSCACTRSIKHSETAVSSAQVGVSQVRRVSVPSRDHPRRVLAVGAGALASASACVRSVENSDDASPGPVGNRVERRPRHG